jgi:hypothetical protein
MNYKVKWKGPYVSKIISLLNIINLASDAEVLFAWSFQIVWVNFN